MNEPPRLLDESDSDFERALLRAGTSYRVSPDLRAKTLSALGIAGAATLTAGVAGSTTLSAAPPAAASPTLLAKLGVGKVLAALAAVGAVASVPVVYFVTKGETPSPSEAPKATTPATPSPKAVEQPADERAPAPEPSPLAEAPRAEAPAPPTAKTERSNAKPAASAAALRAELSALDAARAALAGGNPQGALALLDSYDRANPRGLLRLEAEVLRIDALAKSGRTEAAKKRAEAFLARHPNSVLASRVRGYTSP